MFSFGAYVRLLIIASVLSVSLVMVGQPANATSLKIAPLEYRTALQKGERKKGFIDVSNPTGASQLVRTSVQAFRQTDDRGTLQFYDNEQVAAGVKRDLDEFELAPREAVRMYFELDGTLLPPGDIYAALFFSTVPKNGGNVGQSLRLGTLLSITNGTPGARTAEVTGLSLPLMSLSNQISGTYTIKNTGDPARETGFYPTVTVKTEPFGDSRQREGKLVFAGRSRDNDVKVRAPDFGFFKVSVAYGDSVQSRIVFVATPLALTAMFFVILLAIMVYRLRELRNA